MEGERRNQRFHSNISEGHDESQERQFYNSAPFSQSGPPANTVIHPSDLEDTQLLDDLQSHNFKRERDDRRHPVSSYESKKLVDDRVPIYSPSSQYQMYNSCECCDACVTEKEGYPDDMVRDVADYHGSQDKPVFMRQRKKLAEIHKELLERRIDERCSEELGRKLTLKPISSWKLVEVPPELQIKKNKSYKPVHQCTENNMREEKHDKKKYFDACSAREPVNTYREDDPEIIKEDPYVNTHVSCKNQSAHCEKCASNFKSHKFASSRVSPQVNTCKNHCACCRSYEEDEPPTRNVPHKCHPRDAHKSCTAPARYFREPSKHSRDPHYPAQGGKAKPTLSNGSSGVTSMPPFSKLTDEHEIDYSRKCMPRRFWDSPMDIKTTNVCSLFGSSATRSPWRSQSDPSPSVPPRITWRDARTKMADKRHLLYKNCDRQDL